MRDAATRRVGYGVAMIDAARVVRPTWVWGGALLIVSALLPLVAQYGSAWLFFWTGMIAFAAAMILFAFGRDSVVARRPLGVAALLVLGL